MDLSREQRYEQLLAQVHAPLQRYVRRRSTDGDDVLADTLLVLWRRLDDVPPDACLPWAYGVARGCLQNAHRADERRWRLLHRLSREPDAPTPDADPAMAEAFEELPEADREVLRLWAWEGLAAREIALVLDITPNAASIRLHRATTKLRTKVLGKPAKPRKNGPPAGQEPGRQGQEAPR